MTDDEKARGLLTDLDPVFYAAPRKSDIAKVSKALSAARRAGIEQGRREAVGEIAKGVQAIAVETMDRAGSAPDTYRRYAEAWAATKLLAIYERIRRGEEPFDAIARGDFAKTSDGDTATLDSPPFAPAVARDFAARGFERVNRHAQPVSRDMFCVHCGRNDGAPPPGPPDGRPYACATCRGSGATCGACNGTGSKARMAAMGYGCGECKGTGIEPPVGLEAKCATCGNLPATEHDEGAHNSGECGCEVSRSLCWQAWGGACDSVYRAAHANRAPRTQAQVRDLMASIGPIPSAMASAEAQPDSGAKCAACDGYGVVNKTTGQVCAICHGTGRAPTTGGAK